MKVALVQCPAYDIHAPPINIAYLATYARSKGFTVQVFDLNIDLYHRLAPEDRHGAWNPNKAYIWTKENRFFDIPFIRQSLFDQYAQKIVSQGYTVVCLAVQSTSAIFAIELIKSLKKLNKDLLAIVGGPLCYTRKGYYKKALNEPSEEISFEYGLQNYADAFVVGEGEATLVALLEQIQKTGTITLCPGTVVKIKGKLHECEPRPLIKDLDSIPFPTYEEFDLDQYTEYALYRKMHVLTSRGCTAKCVFCTDTMQWINYRMRSPQHIVDEFKYLKDRYGVETITFNDSVLNGDLKRLEKFCDLLIKENLRVQWGGYARINPHMDRALFRKLNAANCSFLEFGIESGSDEILKKMNKGVTRNDASLVLKNIYRAYNTRVKIAEFYRTLQHAAKTGRLTWNFFTQELKLTLGGKRTKVGTNWIVGFPGESRQDFMKSLSFLFQHRFYVDTVSISMCFINPLSIMEAHPERFLLEYDKEKNWWTQDGSSTLGIRMKRMKSMLLLSRLLGYRQGVVTLQHEGG